MAGFTFNFDKLTPLEKLKKARIQLQQKNSFFAVMSLHLKFTEIDDKFMEMPCGIDADGNFYYKPEWIDKLSEEETEGLLVHEVGHLCLTGDSLVLSEEGFKPIKDIKIGERVYSDKGIFTEVIGKSERDYSGDIHTIRSRSGFPCSFTPDHPILAKQIDNFRVGWGFKKSLEKSYNGKRPHTAFVKASDLKKNDSLVFPIPEIREMTTITRKICKLRDSYKIKKVWLDEDVAYFIGYFVGNGNLSKVKKKGIYLKHQGRSERHITLTMNEKFDHTQLEQIIRSKLLRSPALLKVKDKRAKRLVFSGYGMAKFLRKHFYRNNKKSIPTWMLYEKPEIIEQFIKGLFDSDGHKEGNLKTICSVYPSVYSFIPLLLLRLGHSSFSVSRGKYKTDDGKEHYKYNVGWREDRTHEYSKIIGKKMFHPIRSIDKSHYEGKVYNLETKAHTYCCPYFITHNCLLHLLRRRNREMKIWNVANDIVVNNIAIQNGFKLPKGGLIPSGNQIDLGIVTIKDIDKKTSEEIYDEIPIVYQGGGKGGDGWDDHREGDKDNPLNDKDKKDLENKWLERIEEASSIAQMKGQLPKGMASMIKKLHKSQVNWRVMLMRYLQSYIAYDQTYSRPNKKSISAGFYMPDYLKEKIKVMVVVDMSGSIGNKEVADFMSEIVSIARAYQDRIEMTLLTHDVDVHDEYKIENGIAEKVKKLELHGGGGTSHKPVFKKIDEKYRDTKVAIFLTDGYSDLENINLDKYSFAKLFVINKHGRTDLKLKGSHKLLSLKE
jgi:predicted metal-dependent peptidase